MSSLQQGEGIVVNSDQAPSEQQSTATGDDKQEARAWTIDFGTGKKKHRASRKEKKALEANRQLRTGEGIATPPTESRNGDEVGEVSEKQKELTTVSSTTAGGGVVVDTSTTLEINMEVAVPKKLTTMKEDMQGMRNHFDIGRWNCMVRQYKASCGVSSLTCVWNYLYSRLGAGTLPPVSQEEIMTIIGFQPPFETIRWGPFTGNVTLMRWFHMINKHFGVKGKAYYQYKAHGQGRTLGKTPDMAKKEVKEALLNPSHAMIYHCYNHYMVPIGFQESPLAQVDCYAKELKESDSETWLVIGEVSRGKHPPMHVKKWKDVATDIECASPYYFNIRHAEEGVKKREKTPRKPGGNLHCLIAFRSDLVEEDLEQFENSKGGDSEEEGDEDLETGDALDTKAPSVTQKRKTGDVREKNPRVAPTETQETPAAVDAQPSLPPTEPGDDNNSGKATLSSSPSTSAPLVHAYTEPDAAFGLSTPRKDRTTAASSKHSERKKISIDHLGISGPPTDDQLRDIFQLFDTTGDGKLSISEFKAAFRDSFENYGAPMTERDVDRLFQQFDRRGCTQQDGFLSFEEFSVLVLNRLRQ